jgi:lysophospholipase L1-like esterase
MNSHLPTLSFIAKRLSMMLFCACLFAQTVFAVESTTVPVAREVARHEEFVRIVQAGNVNLIFWGDSITGRWAMEGRSTWDQYFAPLNAKNFGIGGDKTQNLIWRIRNGELSGITPRLAVVMIGINNINAGNTPADIALGIRTILNDIQRLSPPTKVLLLSILPVVWVGSATKINTINSTIAGYANGTSIVYLNVNSRFLTSTGAFRPELYIDGVHLNPAGYQILGSAMVGTVRTMLGSSLAPPPTTVVVLGSSTSAGAGPTNPANAYVNRYRAYAQGINPNNRVINLAVGGYTTYQIMPTNYIPPLGRPVPNVDHNITKALSYHPDGIIINMPSNDVTSGYAITEQLANYDAVMAQASLFHVPVWITTSQPRNISADKRQALMDLRDLTYSRYGPRAIDFWTDVANADGTIKVLYNSGDGTHLNDAGHEILFNRVVAKRILEQLITVGQPDVVVTALSYANGKFNCTVRNQGTGPTPSGAQIGVGFTVDGTWRAAGFAVAPMAAGSTANVVSSGYAVPNGVHTVVAWVDDVNRFTESNENNNQLTQTITVGTQTPPSQSPYGGAAWAVPGTIQAENYDVGGEGVAYHDVDASNNGGAYRTGGVDIHVGMDGSPIIGWTKGGEWLEYTVNVTTAGNYTLEARVSSWDSSGRFHVEFNGINKTGTITMPVYTGTRQTAAPWLTLSRTVSLSVGRQVMKIALDSTGTTNFEVANFNYIRLTAAIPVASG